MSLQNISIESTEIYRKKIFIFRWCNCVLELKNDKLKIIYRNSAFSNSKYSVPIKEIHELRIGKTTDILLESDSDIKTNNDNYEHYSLIKKPNYQKLLGKTINFRIKDADKEKLKIIQKNIAEKIKIINDAKNCHSIEDYCLKNTNDIKNLNHFQISNIFSLLKINHSLTNILISWNFSKTQYIDAFETSCLDYIFSCYSTNELMTKEELQEFFENEQYEKKSIIDCGLLIQKMNIHSKQTTLTIKQFRKLFCEDDENFSLLNPKCQRVWQSMDRPMSEYFIASSHNTYLTGNQLTSNSSYEIYRHVLLDNCRCIEIDVWSDGDKPVVCHGSPSITLTTRICLRKVLEVINENAFVSTNYPLILSIENHLNKKNQQLMAEWMQQIFGDKLHLDEPKITNTNHNGRFPSPKSLIGKIFVKCSKNQLSEVNYSQMSQHNQPLINATRTYLRTHVLNKNLFQKFQDNDKEFGYFENETQNSNIINYQKSSQILESESEIVQNPLKSISSSSSSKSMNTEEMIIDPLFSSLITLFQTTKAKNLEKMKNQPFYKMCSFTDNKSTEELKRNVNLYREITSTNMIRIYPTPTTLKNQFFSANYLPLDHWDAGAQMVALNYQTTQGMLQNSALFQINGSCGYVLKPDYIRFPHKNPPPTLDRVLKLSIRIIGGIFVNVLKKKQNVNLRVVTRVYFPMLNNLELRDLYKSLTTRSIKNNGFTPIWNENFEFELNNPALSIVQFVLLNNEKMLGEYTIAYPAMRHGTRCFNFKDRSKNVMSNAKLFVHIQTSVPKPRKMF